MDNINKSKKDIKSSIITGVTTGISIGFLIPLFISMSLGTGNYEPCTPALVKFAGNEINAVIIQVIATALLGVSFSVSNIIYDVEKWSLFRQSLTYFLINGIVIKWVALVCRWTEFTISSTISFLLIYTIIFFIIWTILYIFNYINIRNMNRKLR